LACLEEVEIHGFRGEDQEFDFLKRIFECAPVLKRVIIKLWREDHEVCTQLRNIFKAHPRVESSYVSSEAS
jgi:hypothetical protein